MKTIMRLVVAGLVCCLGGGAQAAIVTYTFQAKVRSITERENPSANYAGVTQSAIAGKPVALGDILSGSFQYDTSVALSANQPVQQAGSTDRVYESGKLDYISYVDKNSGLAFKSPVSQQWIGNEVRDSTSGAVSDFFNMTHGALDDSMMAIVGIMLDDLSGKAFQSAAMPVELNLASFQFAVVESAFMRLSDNAFVMFAADITSLERVEVPEPGSACLFAIAAGGLFGLRRFRRG